MTETDPQALLPLTHISFQVLLALSDADRHGYAIIKEVRDRTDGRMELDTGTLYTGLKRLRDEGLIEVVPSAERPPDEDRRRRTYRLTTFGRRVVRAEARRLADVLRVAREKGALPATAPGSAS